MIVSITCTRNRTTAHLTSSTSAWEAVGTSSITCYDMSKATIGLHFDKKTEFSVHEWLLEEIFVLHSFKYSYNGKLRKPISVTVIRIMPDFWCYDDILVFQWYTEPNKGSKFTAPITEKTLIAEVSAKKDYFYLYLVCF